MWVTPNGWFILDNPIYKWMRFCGTSPCYIKRYITERNCSFSIAMLADWWDMGPPIVMKIDPLNQWKPSGSPTSGSPSVSKT